MNSLPLEGERRPVDDMFVSRPSREARQCDSEGIG